MLPPAHEMSLVPLPAGDRQSLVLVTSDRLGHLRLGYLLQARFPGLLTAWFTAAADRVATPDVAGGIGSRLAASTSGAAVIAKLKRGEVAEVAAMIRRRLRPADLRKVRRQLLRRAAPAAERRLEQVEQEMFGDELARLRTSAALHPAAGADVATILDAMRRTSPYLVVAYGATLPTAAARLATGLSLTQHDGWLEMLAGPHAVEHALYRRQLAWVGSTTTALIAGQAAPALVRCSSATLHPDDTVAHCVAAAAALGASLMLDTLDDVLANKPLTLRAFTPAPALVAADYSPAMRDAVERDFAAGWLADALAGEQDF